MWQLIAVLIAFGAIPILTRFKVKLSYTLCITALILGLISGIGTGKLLSSMVGVFTQKASLNTVLTVMMVSILGGLMKKYGFLDNIVNHLQLLIRSKKNILMIVPAMIGLLAIPGGAMLSAPFVNDIGEELEINPPRRAAINLVFRHVFMSVLPYSTTLLFTIATFPNLSTITLVGINLLFSIVMLILGNIVYMKDVKSVKGEPRKDIGKNLLSLALYTSPIYMAVILNVILGWPFYITLIASVFIVYIIGDKKDFLKVTIESINWQTVLMIVAVMFMKNIILNMDQLLEIFRMLFAKTDSFFSTLVVLFISALFFGLITGNSMPSLAMVFPMIIQLNPSQEMLYIYIYFASAISFMGYYFSPLHLCQLFTIDIIGVSSADMYKEYRPYIVLLVIALFITTYGLKLIFA